MGKENYQSRIFFPGKVHVIKKKGKYISDRKKKKTKLNQIITILKEILHVISEMQEGRRVYMTV